MKKQNYTIYLITKNISVNTTEADNPENGIVNGLKYEYSDGEVYKKYNIQTTPKKLCKKLKPIFKQQQYNLGLAGIEIQCEGVSTTYNLYYDSETNSFTNDVLKKHNISLKEYFTD